MVAVPFAIGISTSLSRISVFWLEREQFSRLKVHALLFLSCMTDENNHRRSKGLVQLKIIKLNSFEVVISNISDWRTF